MGKLALPYIKFIIKLQKLKSGGADTDWQLETLNRIRNL